MTLAGNGLNAETFGFVITSSLQFRSFSLAQSDFLQPFEHGDPLMSVNFVLFVPFWVQRSEV